MPDSPASRSVSQVCLRTAAAVSVRLALVSLPARNASVACCSSRRAPILGYPSTVVSMALSPLNSHREPSVPGSIGTRRCVINQRTGPWLVFVTQLTLAGRHLDGEHLGVQRVKAAVAAADVDHAAGYQWLRRDLAPDGSGPEPAAGRPRTSPITRSSPAPPRPSPRCATAGRDSGRRSSAPTTTSLK